MSAPGIAREIAQIAAQAASGDVWAAIGAWFAGDDGFQEDLFD